MSGARTHGSLTKDEEVNAAAWAAGRGAVVGASKVSRRKPILYHQQTDRLTTHPITQWAIFSAVAGLVAYQFSPLYRGLTFQFKV